MTMNFEVVTPEMAKQLLQKAARNRPIIRAHVNRLIADLKAGRFISSHQPVGIDVNDLTFDGQHRLLAIVESGIGAQLWVCRNVPVAAVHVTDIGARRTLHDILTIKGKAVHSQHIHISKALMGNRNVTMQEAEQFLDRVWEGVCFAQQQLPKRTASIMGRGHVTAVIARAFYTQDIDRLKRFCAILRSDELLSETLPGDQTPNRLRRAIELVKGKKAGDLYMKTEAALVAFFANRDLKNIAPVHSEQFPFPWEEGDAEIQAALPIAQKDEVQPSV